MVFSANPLSLSVPEPAFESWLRDSGYLEILDQRTSHFNRHTTAVTAATTVATTNATTTTNNFLLLIFSHLKTLLSLFTLNPLAKLTTDDFSGPTLSWTVSFIGSLDSYSFPASPSQARLRVHENVKRYARNYATLFIIFFASTLYQMPLALVGLISSLVLWDGFRLCSDRWGLDLYPILHQALVRVTQCATLVVLFLCNVQMAVFFALAISYGALILHASFRKLTPVKQPDRGRKK